MKTLTTILSVTFLIFFCCACSSGLKLEPQAAASQSAAVNDEQLLFVSQQFHTVTVSPHSLVAAPGMAWRFYIQIKNGSALDVPFNARQVSVSLNGKPLQLLSTDAVRARIISAHDKAVTQARERQKRLVYGDIPPVDEPEDSDVQEEWNPGSSLFDIHALQQDTERHIKAIDDRTKAQLANISQHALSNQNLPPGQVYDTFVEFIPPSTLQSGDILSLKIGIEPDVHIFGFMLAQS